ncbi:tRNA (adenine(22)-N(1))-methyltransferase TrmK [Paenibacillus sp. VCA1]|uniref:tRNA (adenine(22)-N(1))-methyltransferase n=1 Tax=Paenibacillus sp. VCA1 TaxID=3039148 RepID=UPI00287251F1|nr:tRNA (adenine(22)-N(1))-methyltransferase TrmK [Paenibacillus sp. VCA1]MDR9853039.1 tRNA (adenine(22)-N(1))-methyltransferase TrmK [Paenibacillus sp. VCA1]
MKLSKRLETILNLIPEGSRLADIGSDHALLPVAAVQSGRAVRAVAGEVNPGPLKAAAAQVQEAGLGQLISVRKGDGLAVIEAGEANIITIAGMGGSLIANILDNGRDKLEQVELLILQPNVGEDILRRWLMEHGWLLSSERILEEDGKIYEILTAVPELSDQRISSRLLYEDQEWLRSGGDGTFTVTRDLLLRMGPWLLKEPTPVLIEKWNRELDKLQGILDSMSASKLESAEIKAKLLQQEMEQIKEVLACLQKDRP